MRTRRSGLVALGAVLLMERRRVWLTTVVDGMETILSSAQGSSVPAKAEIAPVLRSVVP
jgi:hypothetical protein